MIAYDDTTFDPLGGTIRLQGNDDKQDTEPDQNYNMEPWSVMIK